MRFPIVPSLTLQKCVAAMTSVFWSFAFLCIGAAHAQIADYPAVGYFNGFLNQTNILECDNTSAAAVGLNLSLLSSTGAKLGELPIAIPAFGSRHVILSELASIADRYGSVKLEYISGPSDFEEHLACRTAFYRFTGAGANKVFEFAYVLPIQNPLTGPTGGLYNSINPSGGTTPTLNWLSIVNRGSAAWSGVLEIYGFNDQLLDGIEIANLAAGERRDIPLGHTEGQVAGTYRIVPNSNAAPYDAFLVRYGPTLAGGYQFAFPLRSLPGSCSQQVVQTSTMGNGLTVNWLELANLGSNDIPVNVVLRNVSGANLHQEQRTLPAHGQSHIYVNPYLDPQATGNVGSARVTCANPSLPIVLQSAYYGHVPPNPGIEWSYAVQSGSGRPAAAGEQITAPINTYLGMYNWFKAANSGSTNAPLDYTILNPNGSALASGLQPLAIGGTADIGVHSFTGINTSGTFAASSAIANSSVRGEMLRVLPRADGQIGYVMHIPATVQSAVNLPDPPPPGFFPPQSIWYQDVSAAALDPESATVIQWLQNAGGWGGGSMRIDFSIEVLNADGNTPFRTFVETDDFYSPDCDSAAVPIPAGGAIEGETGYECLSDGDCHLLVVHQPTRKLYEMWRANITGGTFYGGCLAVWDMNRVYGPNGRGQDCTSADAAGFPISPLLFTADEVASGEIKHAIRFILPNSRMRQRVYVHPATHSTFATSGPASAPPYGSRLRLRADYPVSSLPTEGARVVARAMQKYGILLSDGGTIALTAQSDRFTTAKWDGLLDTRDLTALQISDFQMVDGGTRYNYTGDCVREP